MDNIAVKCPCNKNVTIAKKAVFRAYDFREWYIIDLRIKCNLSEMESI